VLATHFLRRQATRYRKNVTGFAQDTTQVLIDHPWRGNVRELEHAVERAVLLTQGAVVHPHDLGLAPTSAASSRIEDRTLEEVEKLLIEKALQRHEGNVSQAAEALGLSRSALYRRLQRHGM
jgi:DNA-binding NtrC family response regulator